MIATGCPFLWAVNPHRLGGHGEWRSSCPNRVPSEFFGCFTAHNAVRQTKNVWAFRENGQTGARLPVWTQTQPLCVGTGTKRSPSSALGGCVPPMGEAPQ